MSSAGDNNPAEVAELVEPGRVVRMQIRFGSGGGFEGDAVAHRHQLRDVVACSAFGVDPGGVVIGAEVAEPGGGVVESRPGAR